MVTKQMLGIAAVRAVVSVAGVGMSAFRLVAPQPLAPALAMPRMENSDKRKPRTEALL